MFDGVCVWDGMGCAAGCLVGWLVGCSSVYPVHRHRLAHPVRPVINTHQTRQPKTQVGDAFDELGELVQEAALDGEGEDGFDDFFEADGEGSEEEDWDAGFDDDDLEGTHTHDVEEVVGEMLKKGRRAKEEL